MRKMIIAILSAILYFLVGLFMGVDIMEMAYAEEVREFMIVKFVLGSIPALFAVAINIIVWRLFLNQLDERDGKENEK